jgi:Xaa-Pro aminopeptidase
MSNPSHLEFETKLARVRDWLDRERLGGVLFLTTANFAWITCGGRSHVSVAAERGVGAVLVTPDAAYLLADNIELARLLEEELAGLPLIPREFPWWSGSAVDEALRLVPAEALAVDVPLPGCRTLSPAETIALRNPLLPEEVARYRALGEAVGVALTHVAFHCRPALTEHQLAGMLGKALMDFGIVPGVTLAAVDERVYTRRHPLPTAKPLERYAMLVVGGRRHGLHVSATRLVHFGAVPEELRDRHAACARVEVALLAATTPGRTLAEIFRVAREAYAAEGYPDEWQRHHQGGPTGYGARDVKVVPDSPGAVQLHQAFAWNPSIAGTKCEDTVLVTAAGIEVLSPTPDLPTIEVTAADITYQRPAILER